MPLLDLELPPAREGALPLRVRDVLEESGARMEAFFERHGKDAVPGFVPGDFERIYRALESVAESDLAPGDTFCEWGSGFGVVTLLAARLDFNACGIEIHESLVDESRALAERFDLDVEFACGNFVPPGGEGATDVPMEFSWLLAGGPCGHDLLGVDPAEFDVVFAYPWPGEERVIEDLFERYAGEGALLLTFHGHEDLRLRRKI